MSKIDDEKSQYYDRVNLKNDTIVEYDRVMKHTSDSTATFTRRVDGSDFYILPIGDVHGLLLALLQMLDNGLKVPNLYIQFVGDMTNTNLAGSTAAPYGAHPEDKVFQQIETLNQLIQKHPELEEMMVFYMDGNHELRLTKMSSFRPGKIVTSAINHPEKYVEDIAKFIVEVKDPLNENKTRTVNTLFRHGEKTSLNPGTNVEQSLNTNIDKGIDFIESQHTHEMHFGNSITGYINMKGKVVERVKYNGNLGSVQTDENYVNLIGCGPSGMPFGEVFHCGYVPNKEKTRSQIFINLENFHDILTPKVNKVYDYLHIKLGELENKEYKTPTEVKKAYFATTRKVNSYVNAISNGSVDHDIPSDSYLNVVALAGFKAGCEKETNDKKSIRDINARIEKDVDVISKLDDSCKVILNGDMVYYKQADFWKKEKYPSDTFSYLELLAEQLKPIKDKIIAYNSGVEETRIMKWHGAELAEYAMTRLQMPEDLAYEPYNKSQMRAEQKKIQSENVEKYNKDTLKKALSTYSKYPARVKELVPYLDETTGSDIENIDTVAIQNLVVKKLRAERKLLSVEKDRAIIEQKFPLEEINLKKPNKNLVQNILYTMLDIDPKTVQTNSNMGQLTINSVKVNSGRNKPNHINIISCYANNMSGRTSEQKKLVNMEQGLPGADIYVTTNKSGAEYMTKRRLSMTDEFGAPHIKDTYYIATARYDCAPNTVLGLPTSRNRVYRFRYIDKKLENNKIGSTSIYQETESYSLICNSLDFNSVMTNFDIVPKIVKRELLKSFVKTNTAVIQKQKEDAEKESTQKIVDMLKSNTKTTKTEIKENSVDTPEDDSDELAM